MIITCPECAAQYELADNAVGPKGRRVKCTSCAFTWLQAPAGEDKVEFIQGQMSENFSSGATASRDVPIAKHTGLGSVALVAGGLAAILLVLFTLFFAFTRNGMTAGWPPLALFYQAIGMSVPAPGAELVFANVESKLGDEGLSVKGKIINNTDKEHRISGLLIAVTGATGRLKEWPIDLDNKPMQPKQEVNFEYTLKDVPAGAENVTVRFAE